MPKKPTTIHEAVAQKYGKKKEPTVDYGDAKITGWTYTANPMTRDQIYLDSIDHRLHAITWLLVIIAASVIGLGVLNLL